MCSVGPGRNAHVGFASTAKICRRVRAMPVTAVRKPDTDNCGPSTSGSSKRGFINELLRGPQPDLFKAHPKVRQINHILRGRHDRLRGLERPLGAVVLPAYLWGSIAAVIGLQSALPVLSGAAVGGLFAVMHRVCNRKLWAAPRQPLTVVVTGGSRGLGKALAREFLAAGDRVLLTSRTQAAADAAVRELREEVAALNGCCPQVVGVAADVSDAVGVAAVEAAALSSFGRVDAWVNNAGYSGSFQPLVEQTDAQIEQVVRTNLLGTLLCTRQAVSLMQHQPGGGHIFNMDGAGADGFATPNYAAYGATKAGITQLTGTLQRELADTPIKLHTVSPGMILTDLLLEGATTANKQAFNILCEHPETVAAFLVPRIKSAVARDVSGTYTRFLTPGSALYRLATAPARLGRFFDKEGRAVYPPERERLMGRHAKSTARAQAAARRQSGSLALAYNLSVLAGVVVLLAEAQVLHHT
eukprot:XP_001697080.1 chlorophyll b reductase [Chlamydomonas reinhardtii]